MKLLQLFLQLDEEEQGRKSEAWFGVQRVWRKGEQKTCVWVRTVNSERVEQGERWDEPELQGNGEWGSSS